MGGACCSNTNAVAEPPQTAEGKDNASPMKSIVPTENGNSSAEQVNVNKKDELRKIDTGGGGDKGTNGSATSVQTNATPNAQIDEDHNNSNSDDYNNITDNNDTSPPTIEAKEDPEDAKLENDDSDGNHQNQDQEKKEEKEKGEDDQTYYEAPPEGKSVQELVDDGYKFDLKNPYDWKLFVERQKAFEQELKAMHEKVEKLPLLELPEDIPYVRPFLSSTFRDFNEERDIAFQTSFPKIEKLCNDRGMLFAPLDLRWGVTSEQSGSGQVIKICLEEVDRCRPYFVCSLGFRNGWALTPDAKPDEDWVVLLNNTFDIGVQAFPWIQDRRDRSVTEIEILHGALNNPQANPRTFFYFRTMDFIEKYVDEDKRWIYVEMGYAELKLMDLKRRIVQAGYTIKFFDNPQEMADLLENDLRISIQADFPVGQVSQLEEELKDNQAFGEMRTRCFVGNQHITSKLDSYLTDKESPEPIVLVGESGSGKSSIIANWVKPMLEKQKALHKAAVKQVKAENKDSHSNSDNKNNHNHNNNNNEIEVPSISQVLRKALNEKKEDETELDWELALIMPRYIGSTSDSVSVSGLLRWIMEEIKERYEMNDKIVPTEPKKIKDEFPDWLQEACAMAPLLLVLDGLDQLEDEDAQMLDWLPDSFPQSMRVICCTPPDSVPLQALSKRRFQQVPVDDLDDKACLKLIQSYLAMFGKNLDNNQEKRIMDCQRTRNPLYLTTFLNEVRVFGSYENLNNRIDHYMEAEDISEMFLKVIGRLESDFDTNAPGLVRYTLSCMMVSRRGLNESELKNLLKVTLGLSSSSPNANANANTNTDRSFNEQKEKPFPNMEFSALMLQLDSALVNQRGLRTFSHNYLRDAVLHRYFSPSSDSKENTVLHIHRRLADYFQTVDSLRYGNRVVEELPYHLFSLSTAARATKNNEVDSVDALKVLGDGKQSIDSLINQLDQELENVILDLDLFEYYKLIQHKFDLHRYWRLLEKHKQRNSGGGKSTSDLYHDKLTSWKRWVEEISKQEEEAKNDKTKKWEESKYNVDYATKAEEIGTWFSTTWRFDGAERFLDEAIEARIQEPGGEKRAVVEKLYKTKAELLHQQGIIDKALELYQKALSIIREPPSAADIEANKEEKYGKWATITDPAERLKEINKERSIRASELVASIAGILKDQKKYDKALPLYQKSLDEQINMLGDSHHKVGVTMSNLAELYNRKKQPSQALPLQQKALKIMEVNLGHSHPQVAILSSNLASTYSQLKQNDEAFQMFQNATKIKEKMYGPNHVSLLITLANTAVVARNIANSKAADAKSKAEYNQKALDLFLRTLAIREANNSSCFELLKSLKPIALVQMSLGQHSAALVTHQRIVDMLQDQRGSNQYKSKDEASAYNKIGQIYAETKKDNEKAIQNYNKAIDIYKGELNKISDQKNSKNINDQQIEEEKSSLFSSIDNVADRAGSLYFHQQAFAKALPFYELSKEMISNLKDINDQKSTRLRLAEIQYWIGQLCFSISVETEDEDEEEKMTVRAKQEFEGALTIRASELGESHEATQEVQTALEDLEDDELDEDEDFDEDELDDTDDEEE